MSLLQRTIIPSWDETPIPGLSLSAGGLLALTDLNTIAQRTALTGGSSWLDAFVLAPGLHYQQAADALDRELVPGWNPSPNAVELIPAPDQDDRGRATCGEIGGPYAIVNHATLYFLKKVSKGEVTVVNLDVAIDKLQDDLVKRLRRLLSMKRRKRTMEDDENPLPDMDWLSHLLYLASPLLTVAALVFMVLFEDWWGLAFILALMLSRILNIWVIKQRAKPISRQDFAGNHPTEWTIDLGLGRRVLLRGQACDLQAITTQAWLRSKTNLDGYFEAASKLIVYLVATFSGNLTQAGAMVFMALLIVSAGLLGLSNAQATEFRTHGRIARPQAYSPGAPAMEGTGP